MFDKLFIGNANLVAVNALREDAFAGTYLNAATVEAVLLSVSGTTVSGPSFPISCAYVTSSAGIYEGVIPATTVITEGTEYDLLVTADYGGVQVARWFKRFVAVERRS